MVKLQETAKQTTNSTKAFAYAGPMARPGRQLN